MAPVPGSPTESICTWIYSIDIKGWIPKSVVVRCTCMSFPLFTHVYLQSRANLEQPLHLTEMRDALDRYVRNHGTAWALDP